jgi:hypothetical protein
MDRYQNRALAWGQPAWVDQVPRCHPVEGTWTRSDSWWEPLVRLRVEAHGRHPAVRRRRRLRSTQPTATPASTSSSFMTKHGAGNPGRGRHRVGKRHGRRGLGGPARPAVVPSYAAWGSVGLRSCGRSGGCRRSGRIGGIGITWLRDCRGSHQAGHRGLDCFVIEHDNPCSVTPQGLAAAPGLHRPHDPARPLRTLRRVRCSR